jgi:hypothetical protein
MEHSPKQSWHAKLTQKGVRAAALPRGQLVLGCSSAYGLTGSLLRANHLYQKF